MSRLEVKPNDRSINVVIERDSEGYYVASVPELRGCHTQAKLLNTLMKRIREAIELCLKGEGERARFMIIRDGRTSSI